MPLASGLRLARDVALKILPASFASGCRCAQVSDSHDWLERAGEARSGRLVWLNSGTPFCRIAQYFDHLRSEVRFQRLLDRIHLRA